MEDYYSNLSGPIVVKETQETTTHQREENSMKLEKQAESETANESATRDKRGQSGQETQHLANQEPDVAERHAETSKEVDEAPTRQKLASRARQIEKERVTIEAFTKQAGERRATKAEPSKVEVPKQPEQHTSQESGCCCIIM